MGEPIKFSAYEEKILEAIKSKLPYADIHEELSLVNGFINQPIHKELTSGFVVGGPSIPMVSAVGKKSGRMYFFALKALIQDIEI